MEPTITILCVSTKGQVLTLFQKYFMRFNPYHPENLITFFLVRKNHEIFVFVILHI